MSAPYATFIELLGIRYIERSKERIVAEMDTGDEHTNGRGIVHGGVYMAFADTLGAQGARQHLPEGMQTSTLESKTNFLRGTKPGTLKGICTPVHLGRTTTVWTTEVLDADGRKLAVVTQTQLNIPARG